MTTSTIELYVEKIRSGIEVTGMIGDEYIEMRYKNFLSSNGNFERERGMNIIETIARSHAEFLNRKFEAKDNEWKSGRRKLKDEHWNIIGIVESFLNENDYIIIE